MSDDIPVGSPPAPPGRHAAPGGWYADPARAGQERYWDGWQWTRNVRPAEGGSPAGHSRPGQGQGPQRPGHTYTEGYAPGPGAGPGAGSGARVPMTADGVPLAPWGARVGAALIDGIIVDVLTAVLLAVSGVGTALMGVFREYMAYVQELVAAGSSTPDPARVEQLIAGAPVAQLVGLSVLVHVSYHAIWIGTRGATLGKLALGLGVVRHGRGRDRTPGWAVALTRPLAVQLLGMFPYLSYVLKPLDVLFPLWDRDRQTLHDKMVRTQVVRRR